MIWRIILSVVGFIGVLGFTADKEIIPAIFCAAVIIVPALIQLYRTRKLKPSAMICPTCGSDNIFISNRFEGMVTGTDVALKRSFVFPNHRAKMQTKAESQVNRQRIARCQQCGFDFRFVSAGEVQQARSDAIKSVIIAVVLLGLGILFGMAVK